MGHGVDGCEVGVRGGEVRDRERGATDDNNLSFVSMLRHPKKNMLTESAGS